MKEETQLIPDLFRKEFAKMVAVISKLYGLQHIEIAEDIVSETFLTATENWTQKGYSCKPNCMAICGSQTKNLISFQA